MKPFIPDAENIVPDEHPKFEMIDLIGNGHGPTTEKWRDGIWCSTSFLRQPHDPPILSKPILDESFQQLHALAEVYGKWDRLLLLDAERFWPWSTFSDEWGQIAYGEKWFIAMHNMAHRLFPQAEIRWYSGSHPERWPSWANLAVPCYMGSAAKRSYTRAVAQTGFSVMSRALDARGLDFLPLVMPRPIDLPGLWEPEVFQGFFDGLNALGFRRVGVFEGVRRKGIDELLKGVEWNTPK